MTYIEDNEDDDDSFESNSYNELEERIIDIENNTREIASQIIERIDQTASFSDIKGCLFLIIIYIPGLVLSMLLSWTTNPSILETILHGYLSWGYVIYHVLI